MSDFTAANHYEITGAGITGTVDLAGFTGQPVAAIEVDGQSLAEPSVGTDEAGVQVKATVQEVDDGDTVRLQLVLPEVNISDEPVAVAGFAVLLTQRSSIAGPSLVKGPLKLYDLRPIAATASAVRA